MDKDVLIKTVVVAVKKAIFNEDNEIPTEVKWKEFLNFCLKSQISPIAFYGLKDQNNIPEKAKELLTNFAYQNIVFDEKQKVLSNGLFSEFEKNKIEYFPLKGTSLKRLYPSSDMRVMGDVDVLIHPKDYKKIKEILKSTGATFKVESDHEYVWELAPNIVFEFHKRLIPSYNKDFYRYYGDGWKFAQKCENSYMHKFSNENELVYIFTHFSKHYRDGGIGVRQMIDLWLFVKKIQFDEKYVEEELEKLNLLKFYKNTLKAISVLFEGKESDEVSEKIINRVFSSGSYGAHEKQLEAKSFVSYKKSKGVKRARFFGIFKLLFPSYVNMRISFPVLSKAPVLLPLFWVVRWFKNAFNFKKYKKHKTEMATLNEETVSDYGNELKEVGLDFNF